MAATRRSTSGRSGGKTAAASKRGGSRKKADGKSTGRQAGRTQSKAAAQAPARKRRRQRKQRIDRVRQGVRQAVQAVYLVLGIGVLLVVLSVAFVLYQWKEVAIVEAAKQIEVLREEVRALESARSRREGLINNTLLQESRLVGYSREKLGLERTIEQPTVFAVDKDTWMYYVRKDAAAAQHAPSEDGGE